jgi:hypothetical protein
MIARGPEEAGIDSDRNANGSADVLAGFDASDWELNC